MMNRLLQVAFLSVFLNLALGQHVRGETLFCKRTSGSEEKLAFLGLLPGGTDLDSDYMVGGVDVEAVVSYLTSGSVGSGIVSAGVICNADVNDIVAVSDLQCYCSVLVSAVSSIWQHSDVWANSSANFEVQPSLNSAIVSGLATGYLSIVGGQSGTGYEEGHFSTQIGPYTISGDQSYFGGWDIHFAFPGGTEDFSSSAQELLILVEFPVSVSETVPMYVSQTFNTEHSGTHAVNISSTAFLNFSVEAYDPEDEDPVDLHYRIKLKEGDEEDEVPIYYE